MTVYVDDMDVPFQHKGRIYKLSHMIADTEEELHSMADIIGLNRKYYQEDHYDISLTKKSLAIKNGAILLTYKQLALKFREIQNANISR